MISTEQTDPVNVELLIQQRSGLEKLVELTCHLAGMQDLEEVLETVTTEVCEALNCKRATLYLFDEKAQELYTHVALDLEISEIRTPIDYGISGWVARRLKVANIPDPHVDARWDSSIDKKTGFKTRNILAAPVISVHNNKLLGVLQLLNKEVGSFDEFDEQMIQAFASHAGTALERAFLQKEAERAHRLQAAIDLGRSVQTGFLPQDVPPLPGYAIAHWWQPAESVGGDYFDVITLPDGRLGLVMADVCGHGFAPSLLMASAHAMLRVICKNESDPGTVLSILSESMVDDLNDRGFLTIIFVAFDMTHHNFTYANAGHAPALFFQRATSKMIGLPPSGMPIGFDATHCYTSHESIQTEPGDTIFLATDGLIEQQNQQGEMYGKQRLEKLLIENCSLPAEEIMQTVQQSLKKFSGSQQPKDDISILLLERKYSEK